MRGLYVYLYVYNRSLAELIDRFAADMKTYKPAAVMTSDESNLLPSCADLFIYYKKCMKQCSELSNGLVSSRLELISPVYQHYSPFIQRSSTLMITDSLDSVSNFSV